MVGSLPSSPRGWRRRGRAFWLLAPVLSLALGVNGALFSVLDGLVFAPLPYPDADRIVHLNAPYERFRTRPVVGEHLRSAVQSLPLSGGVVVARRAVFQPGSAALIDWNLRPVFVAPGFFELFGVQPLRGRAFVDGDVGLQPRPVIVSESVWRTRLGADPAIVGQSLAIPGALGDPVFTVIGVAPADFSFPGGANLWLPYVEREFPPSFVPTFARLDKGASIELMRSALPEVDVETLRQYVRPDGIAGVVLLAINTVLLALLAWIQMATLTYARGVDQRVDVQIRVSLGARRSHLCRQLLSEGAGMWFASFGIGWLLMMQMMTLVVAWLPAEMTVGQHLTPGTRAFAYVLLLHGCALLIWFAVAWPMVVRAAMLPALSRSDGVTATRTAGLRLGVLAVQVGAATTLAFLLGATYLGYRAAGRIDPGFDAERLFAYSLPPPTAPSGTPAGDYRTLEALHTELTFESLRQIRTHPGVESAALAFSWPMAPEPGARHVVLDEVSRETVGIVTYRVGVDYFETIGATLVAGRGATADEARVGTQVGSVRRVAVVNQALAGILERRGPVLGQELTMSAVSTVVVVGVVKDIEDDALDGRIGPAVYTFLPDRSVAFAVLVRLRPNVSAATVHELLQGIWGSRRQSRRIVALESVLWDASAEPRARVLMMLTIALSGLPLVVVGVAGTVREIIRQTWRDYAIRVALGCEARILATRLVLKVLVGGVLGAFGGVAVGFAVLSTMRHFIADLRYADWTVAVFAATCLLFIVYVTARIAAGRLSAISPTELLRQT